MATAGNKLDEIQEDFLTCKICLQPYTKPKALECLHTFCLHCIEGYRIKEFAKDAIPCPICKNPTKIPAGGVKELKSNFFIESLQDTVKTQTTSEPQNCDNCINNEASFRCFDCNENLCKSCQDAHKLVKVTRKHKLVDLAELKAGKHQTELKASQKMVCQYHEDEHFKFFCQTCTLPICITCKVVDHDSHKCLPLTTASKEQLPKFKNHIQQFTSLIGTTKIALAKLKNMKQKLATSKTKVEQSIEKRTLYLIQQIQNYEKELLSQNEQCFATEQKQFNALDDFYEITLAGLESTNELCKQLVAHSNEVQLLSMVRDVEGQLAKFKEKPLSKSITFTNFGFKNPAPAINMNNSWLGSITSNGIQELLAPPNEYTQTPKALPRQVKQKIEEVDDPEWEDVPEANSFVCTRCGIQYMTQYACYHCHTVKHSRHEVVTCICGYPVVCPGCMGFKDFGTFRY